MRWFSMGLVARRLVTTISPRRAMVRSLRAYPVPKRLGHLALHNAPVHVPRRPRRTGRGVTLSPLVSVVMPVLNGADTIGAAVESVLGRDAHRPRADRDRRRVDRRHHGRACRHRRRAPAGQHASRVSRPHRVVALGGRAGDEWSRRPHGRRRCRLSRSLALEYDLFHRVSRRSAWSPPRTRSSTTTAPVFATSACHPITLRSPWGCCSGCCLAHPTVMFRRDVYRLVGGYREDEFPADDYGLWLRMVDVTQVATR